MLGVHRRIIHLQTILLTLFSFQLFFIYTLFPEARIQTKESGTYHYGDKAEMHVNETSSRNLVINSEINNDTELYLHKYPIIPKIRYRKVIYGLDFTGIPYSTSVEHSIDYLQTRIDQALLSYTEGKKIGEFPTSGNDRVHRFEIPAIVHAKLGLEGDLLNEIIMSPKTKKWGLYGSSFHLRKGDYDFTSNLLATLMLTDLNSHRLLSAESIQKLQFELLPSGPDIYLSFEIAAGLMYKDTENHILMANVGRYLNNQEIFKHNQTTIYDNSKNGLDDWMLEHLRMFFIHWFEEYNSKPYQKYTIFALNNLASFADNSRVKLAANMLLDLVSAVYAIQSNNGRRLAPFCRQEKYNKDKNSLGANTEYARFAVLAGTFSASRGSGRNGYKSNRIGPDQKGQFFKDLGACEQVVVVELKLYASETALHGIETTVDCGSIHSTLHGSSTLGKPSKLVFEREEYIEEVEILCGVVEGMEHNTCTYMKVTTSHNRTLEAGNNINTDSMLRMHHEKMEGFYIHGFGGRIMDKSYFTTISVIRTPLNYLYEEEKYRIAARDAASLAAVHSYRVPPMILDLMIRRDHNTHFQALRHFGQELYFSSKSYLISGGGIYAHDYLWGTSDIGSVGNHGWATPTMIIATQDPSNNARSWIRIEGHTSLSKKINHSIYRNFATGSNLFIPGYIPYSCRKVVDGTHWKFFDFASAECPLQYGFYVAVYQEPCGRSLPQKSRVCISNGANWGFWETREASELSFDAFLENIIRDNKETIFDPENINRYVMSTGDSIDFEGIPSNPWRWGIVSVNGVMQNQNIDKWPLFQGDILNDNGKGKVEIVNPYLQKCLYIDMSDALSPFRLEVQLEDVITSLYRTLISKNNTDDLKERGIIETWMDRLLKPGTKRISLVDIASALFSSSDFISKSSTEKVSSLFSLILGDDGVAMISSDAVEKWSERLESGQATMHRIATHLIESPVFKSLEPRHVGYVTRILELPGILWNDPEPPPNTWNESLFEMQKKTFDFGSNGDGSESSAYVSSDSIRRPKDNSGTSLKVGVVPISLFVCVSVYVNLKMFLT